MPLPKPHIWKHKGIWHCGLKGAYKVAMKGYTPTKAYAAYVDYVMTLLWIAHKRSIKR
jgi:hypothetical protein